DFPETFHVSITQNQALEEMGSQQMDSPTKSRLSTLIKTAPDPSRNDWVDRIAQKLTGVSVNQLYEAVEEFQTDYALLSKVLSHYRQLGLTPEQKKNLKTLQAEDLRNIKDIEDIIQFARSLGDCLEQLSQLVNPNSPYFKTQDTSLSEEYKDYLREKAQ